MISSPIPRRLLVCSALLLTLAGATDSAGEQRPVQSSDVRDLGDAWLPAAAAAAADLRDGLVVDIQFDVLRAAAGSGGVLTLPLPGGLSVRVGTNWVQADATQSMVAGALLNAEGEASLTLVGNALAGRIVANGRLYIVRRVAGSDAHLVTQVDRASLPPERVPRAAPEPAAAAERRIAPQPAGDTNAFVDVMVVYTPAARAQSGGTSTIVAELTGAINHANLALANANVVHRFRLVHQQEVAYTEVGSMGTTLTRLQNTADGVMDEVGALREQYKADLVALLSADSDGCGLGYLMGPGNISASFAPYGYSVTYWPCANANLTLAHEIGHNMGLHHDRANAGSNPQPAFPYAFGYAIPGVARDVMAYDCAGGCTRKAIYSTSSFNFPGTAVRAGTPNEDNAQALNGTSMAVANFRQAVSCAYTLSSSAATATAGGGTASVSIITASTCSWSATTNSPGVLAVTSGSTGRGNGVVTYSVSPNRWTPRNGSLAIAGRTFVVSQAQRNRAFDFDDDGRTDVTVYRPSSGMWYMLTSGSSFTAGRAYQWGVPTDVPVTGDFDGDAKNDITVFRPESGQWFVLKSTTNFTAGVTYQWGMPGAIPMPADYDGDGVTDLGFYLPSNGRWYVRSSITSYTDGFEDAWGAGIDLPQPGDYDGDRIADLALYRPTTGHWFIKTSTTGYASWLTYQWGTTNDKPVPADYDGDGKTDIAIYRKSNGTWCILTSGSNFTAGWVYTWGADADVPIPGDYDGDGRADLTVYRPSSGYWFVLESTTNYTSWKTYQWGTAGDIPVPGRQ
jgi:hypothetical protein